MNFIRLDVAISAIACEMKAHGAQDPRGAASCSGAAARLHQSLHNRPETAPRWVEVDAATGLPLFSPGVAAEAMAILKHLSGWTHRIAKARMAHLRWCSARGLDPDREPQLIRPDDDKYGQTPWGRWRQIGFDRAELAGFLEAHEIAHALPQIDGEDDDEFHASGNALVDPARRLKKLKDLGGSAQWRDGEWHFKGIGKLMRDEKEKGFSRSDDKTIRSDLRKAAIAIGQPRGARAKASPCPLP